jgi:hypothetical protein
MKARVTIERDNVSLACLRALESVDGRGRESVMLRVGTELQGITLQAFADASLRPIGWKPVKRDGSLLRPSVASHQPSDSATSRTTWSGAFSTR